MASTFVDLDGRSYVSSETTSNLSVKPLTQRHGQWLSFEEYIGRVDRVKGRVCADPAINSDETNPLRYRCLKCVTKMGAIEKRVSAETARRPWEM